jgi:transposase
MELPEGKIKCGRVVKRASGWYLCLFIDAEPKAIERVAFGKIGIDSGFSNLLTTSDGEIIEHPRELEASAERLAQAQRGHNKQLAARIQERIANRKRDRNHKLSHRLVSENIFIAFSKDNIKGMAKRFGKSVASSAHYQLRQMLSYKMPKSGGTYVEPESKFSTKTCSECGSQSGPTGFAGLSVRHWSCPCGAEHDRDINAARNTLFAGAGLALERSCANA